MIDRIRKLRVENKKHRKLYLSIIFILFLFMDIGLVYMTASTSEFQSTMNQPKSYAWLQLLNSYLFAKLFFTPILLAVIVSRVVDIENIANMWKILKTCGWTRKEIFDVKFLVILIKYILFQTVEFVFFIVMGKKVGITMPIPMERFVVSFFSIVAISFAIMTFHYFLSMRYENQLIGLALGVVGSMFGIIGTFLPLSISRFIPYSYYAHLIATEFVKVGESEWILKVVSQRNYPLIVSLVLGVVIFLWSRKKINKLDF